MKSVLISTFILLFIALPTKTLAEDSLDEEGLSQEMVEQSQKALEQAQETLDEWKNKFDFSELKPYEKILDLARSEEAKKLAQIFSHPKVVAAISEFMDRLNYKRMAIAQLAVLVFCFLMNSVMQARMQHWYSRIFASFITFATYIFCVTFVAPYLGAGKTYYRLLYQIYKVGKEIW